MMSLRKLRPDSIGLFKMPGIPSQLEFQQSSVHPIWALFR